MLDMSVVMLYGFTEQVVCLMMPISLSTTNRNQASQVKAAVQCQAQRFGLLYDDLGADLLMSTSCFQMF